MTAILRLQFNIGLAVLIILSVLIPGMTVSAQANAEVTAIGDVTDPGMLPDSGIYFMKSWGRNLQLMFAGSEIAKARLMLKYTNEDALALKKMYEMGKYDVGARHTEQYELQLQNTVLAMEQVRTKQGEEVSQQLNAELEQNYLKQQEVLLSVLEKAPEAAQAGILNAIENSNKHVAAMILAQEGQEALQGYQEQVNQQTQNMGEETKIKVLQRLQVMHSQATQSSGDNSSGQDATNQQTTQTQTQTQSQIQTQVQTQLQTQNQVQIQIQAQTSTQAAQQTGQQNMQNQGTGQSNSNSGGGNQGSGNNNQGK